jgi:hypothetical protein
VLAIAGMPVFAFQKLEIRRSFLSEDIRLDRSKGRRDLSLLTECSRGRPACRAIPILSETAGVPRGNIKFPQRLNSTACIDG